MVRRLPWASPPSGCASPMRPTPLMMPVNMPRLSQRLEVCAAVGAGDQAQVFANAVDAHPFELQGVVQRCERAKGRHLAAGTEELGREVDEELVDQPFANEGAIELVAGLDVQLVDAPRGQVVE